MDVQHNLSVCAIVFYSNKWRIHANILLKNDNDKENDDDDGGDEDEAKDDDGEDDDDDEWFVCMLFFRISKQPTSSVSLWTQDKLWQTPANALII